VEAMVTEVILCKECKWRKKSPKDGAYRCSARLGLSGVVKIKDDDFCPYGEKEAKK
jgi:hypothetical protein